MSKSLIIKAVILLFLVFLSAFFSSAETAFSCANKIKLKAKNDEGNKRAGMALKIIDSYSNLLSCILIGNNIVNLTASSLATVMASETGLPMAVSIATGVLTVVILFCGEIIPKTWANIHPDSISIFYAPLFKLLLLIMTPIIFIVDKITIFVLKIIRIDPNKKNSTITESEIRTFISEGQEDGAIEEEEKEILNNVFDFGDSNAKDIMIPRIDMVMIDINANYKEVIKVFRDSMYTRLPVYEGTLENVVGVINIKDFILVKNPDTFTVKKYIREVYYTYEYKKTSDLLNELRKSCNNICMVLNEYGSTVGMITLEDLLEEIVGEIRDEYDKDEETLIEKLDERSYLIPGNMKLDDINDNLKTTFANEDYDTLAGIIIDYLDMLPKEGEKVTLEDGTVLVAQTINKNRIQQIKVTLPELSTESENTEEK